jgi:hypothetical protein
MRSGDELGKWKWEIKLGKYKRKVEVLLEGEKHRRRTVGMALEKRFGRSCVNSCQTLQTIDEN